MAPSLKLVSSQSPSNLACKAFIVITPKLGYPNLIACRFEERNVTFFPVGQTGLLVYEPCNYASNIAYYQVTMMESLLDDIDWRQYKGNGIVS